ncbi:MAG: Fur family transcriptional regulator [Prevotella sp.]|nr:Fur family transcriptional regulator [Prevotella sp.]
MTNNDEKKLDAYERLTRHGIRPSAQRVAIMQYIMTHHTHPTVGEIFDELCPLIPTLSKTTVYNTLRMFSEKGAAQMITIDDHHICYDDIVMPHAHFICRECGCVRDINNIGMPTATRHGMREEGCVIDEVQIYCKGICDKCLSKQTT